MKQKTNKQLRNKILLATASFLVTAGLAYLAFYSLLSGERYYPTPEEVEAARAKEEERSGRILKAAPMDLYKLHRKTGDSVLYGLDPTHPQVNSHGHRDSEISLAKPAGMQRILVLGDSIAFGRIVAKKDTFPNLLEARLNKEHAGYQVINSGVPGYTTYNEVQHYLVQGRQLQPDLVLLAFCMNDIVNPRLHWGYTKDRLENIPDAAFPNLGYDRDHAVPILAREKPMTFAERDKEPPTYLSNEDNLSIELLLDRKTEEWQWLTKQLLQLQAAVQADGATLVVVVFPLAYQMDEGYPHFPQPQFAAFCKEHAIAYLDLLPEFRKHPVEELYILDRQPGWKDIWHLMDYGHQVTADIIFEKLREMER